MSTSEPRHCAPDTCGRSCHYDSALGGYVTGWTSGGISVDDQPCTCPDHVPAEPGECTEHDASARSLAHSCFPDGSSVTLWRAPNNPGNGAPRALVAVVDSPRTHLAEDGSRGTYTGQVERMRARYEAERARLAADQT